MLLFRIAAVLHTFFVRVSDGLDPNLPLKSAKLSLSMQMVPTPLHAIIGIIPWTSRGSLFYKKANED